MKTFFTSDLHLGHKNILKHCNRPFKSIEEMNEALIDNWNRVVAEEDLIYILGDFAWKDHDVFLRALKGQKVLIKGNHDKIPKVIQRKYFIGAHGILTRKFNGKKITMCHYAMKSWPGSRKGHWHLYGHSHGRLREEGNRPKCDVGVDVWNYTPVPLEVIVEKLKRREMETPINHESEDNVVDNRIENLSLL